jgi:hypothetical protein
MHTFEALQFRQCFDGLAGFPMGDPNFVKALQVEPEFRSRAKEMAQAQCRIAGDGAPPIQDLGDAVGRNVESAAPALRRSFPVRQVPRPSVPRGGSLSRA